MSDLLTPNEQAILKLKSDGLNNADIARNLSVSPSHITQTFTKISGKITGVNDTLKLLKETGIMQKSSNIGLTAKGTDALKKVKGITVRIPRKQVKLSIIKKHQAFSKPSQRKQTRNVKEPKKSKNDLLPLPQVNYYWDDTLHEPYPPEISGLSIHGSIPGIRRGH